MKGKLGEWEKSEGHVSKEESIACIYVFLLIYVSRSTVVLHSYLRIAQVLKWSPIHKIWEQLPEKPSRGAQKA